MLSLYRLWVFITPTCQCCTYGPTHKATGADVIINETWKPTVIQIPTQKCEYQQLHRLLLCALLCSVCHLTEEVTRKTSKGELLTLYYAPMILLVWSKQEGLSSVLRAARIIKLKKYPQHFINKTWDTWSFGWRAYIPIWQYNIKMLLKDKCVCVQDSTKFVFNISTNKQFRRLQTHHSHSFHLIYTLTNIFGSWQKIEFV